MNSTSNTETAIEFKVVEKNVGEQSFQLNLVPGKSNKVLVTKPNIADSTPQVSVCPELLRDRVERRRCINCTLAVAELWFFRPLGNISHDRICVHKCVRCGAGRSQCSFCS